MSPNRRGVGYSGWGQGACAGDYDNDGFVDLFVTYYGLNRLYHNNGDGTFREVAASAGRGGREGPMEHRMRIRGLRP